MIDKELKKNLIVLCSLAFILIFSLSFTSAFCKLGGYVKNSTGDFVSSNITAHCENKTIVTNLLQTQFKKSGSAITIQWGTLPGDKCSDLCTNVWVNATWLDLNNNSIGFGYGIAYPLNETNSANWATINTNENNVTVYLYPIIYPTIEFVLPTENSGGYINRGNILINISSNSASLSNISAWLFNSTLDLINSTNSSLSPLFYNFSGLLEGLYFFNAAACDISNNCNSTETRNVTIDLTAPNATLIFPFNGTLNKTLSQNYTVNLTDNYGLKNATLYIYNSSSSPSITSISFSGNPLEKLLGIVVSLGDGSYNWFYSVFDLAGNSFTTGNNTLSLDASKPQIQITYPLNINYNVNISELNYTVSDGNLDSCWYSNDSGAINSTSVAAGLNFTDIASREGGNTWTVYCNDSAGNLNSSSKSFFVDTLYPYFEIIPNNVSVLYGQNIGAQFVGNDSSGIPVSYFINWTSLFSIDSSGFLKNTSSMGVGTYYIEVSVNDSVGNINSTIFRVDVNQTVPILSHLLNGINNNLTVVYPNQINASGNTNGGTLVISREGVAIGNGANYTLGVGYYQFDFNVTGNQNYTNLSATLYANVTQATPTLVALLNGGSANITGVVPYYVNASATATGGNLSIYRNGILIANGQNDSLGAGDYRFDFNVTGNQNYTDAYAVLYANITLYPNINFMVPSETSGFYLTRDNIMINVTASNMVNISVRLYNSTRALINSSNSTTSPLYINFTGLANGIYYFNATACDYLNNCNNTETRNVTIDIALPNATLINPINGSYSNNHTQNFTANLSDNLGLKNATLNVYNQTGLYNQTTQQLGGVLQTLIGIPVVLVDGAYNWFYNLFDIAGNNFISVNNTVTIDGFSPLISIVYPANITYAINVSSLNYTVSDANLKSCWYSLDLGVTNTSVTCGINLTNLTSTEGSNTWKVWVNDSAGNVNVSGVTFYKDTIKPSFSNLVNLTYYDGNSLGYDFDATDNSGLSCFSVNDKINFNMNCSGYLKNATNLAAGIYWINISVNDTLNNLNSAVLYINHTINLAPNITLVAPDDGYSATGSSVNVDFIFNLSQSTSVKNCSVNIGGLTSLVIWNSSSLNDSGNLISQAFSPGTYSWSINCTGYNGVSGNTSTRSFIINSPPGGGGGGGGCHTNYVCSEWGQCKVDETQIRICHDIGSCKKINKSELRNCTYVPEKPKVKANCSDKILNNGESDIDCGGICDKCDEGKKCRFNEDCRTNSCESGVCTKKTEKNITIGAIGETKEKKFNIWFLLFWLLVLVDLILLILFLIRSRKSGVLEIGGALEKATPVKKLGVVDHTVLVDTKEPVYKLKEVYHLGASKNMIRVSQISGKEVYTETGDFFGTVKYAVLGKDTVYGLKIKLGRKMRKEYGVKKVILRYGYVKNIKEVIVIKSQTIDRLNEKIKENNIRIEYPR